MSPGSRPSPSFPQPWPQQTNCNEHEPDRDQPRSHLGGYLLSNGRGPITAFCETREQPGTTELKPAF